MIWAWLAILGITAALLLWDGFGREDWYRIRRNRELRRTGVIRIRRMPKGYGL